MLFFPFIFNFNLDDVFILDRGFTRCVSIYGFVCPETIQTGCSQLTAEQANFTRKVTKCRNIIERGFGRLKQWKILKNVINNRYIPKLHKLVRILAATDNLFGAPLWGEKETDQMEREIQSLLDKDELENNLMKALGNNSLQNWRHRPIEQLMEQKIIPFNLCLQNIQNWNCGDYAIRLAPRYLQHSDVANFKLYVHQALPKTIRINGIISRHSGQIDPRKYIVCLQFRTNDMNDTIGYCTCKSGARTMGSCAHVIAGLMYLWFKSNNKEIPIYNLTALSYFSETSFVVFI